MTGHVAFVLPGRGYGPLGPAIRLPRLAVEQSGAQSVDIRYRVLPDDDDPESWATLQRDVRDQIGLALTESEPTRVTFIAKSLGTVLLAGLPALPSLPSSVRAVWLTPILGREPVRAGIVAKSWPSLLVGGQADPFHEPGHHDAVAGAISAESLVLPGADHLLEVPGDVMATMAGFRLLTERVLAFAG